MARLLHNKLLPEPIPVQCKVCKSASLIENATDVGGPHVVIDATGYIHWMCSACGSMVTIGLDEISKLLMDVRKDKKVGSMHTKC